MKNEPFYKGSSKNLYRRIAGYIDIEHTDFFSVFDVGRSPYGIRGKGKAICDCTVSTFLMAKAIGVPTHFIDQIDSTTIRVKEFDIPRPAEILTPLSRNYVLPVEWIDREKVAGSINRDFCAGLKKPRDFGFASNNPPKIGTSFGYPIRQTTTKREKVDRELSKAEACSLAGITEDEYDRIWLIASKLNGAIGLASFIAGFHRIDGKKEFGVDEDRRIVLLDSAGTLDEDRFFPAEPLSRGVVVNYSKEYLRQKFIDCGYYNEVQEARKKGLPDPPYPILPDEVLEECSNIYTEFAEKYLRQTISL